MTAIPEGLPPIECDTGMDRTYIPLPGGWEVQTKGKGSTFRICTPQDETMPVLDSPYLHETIEAMARGVHAASTELAARAERAEAALLASQQANAGLVAVDVRTQANGKVDEIVGYGHFHLERMDSGHWWLGLGDEDRGGAMVNLTSSRAILVSVSGDAAIATQDLQAQGAVQEVGNG